MSRCMLCWLFLYLFAKLDEETVNSQLREKNGEKLLRMQRYDDGAFALYDELFSYACPKFITPSAPSFEEPLINYNQDMIHVIESKPAKRMGIIFCVKLSRIKLE